MLKYNAPNATQSDIGGEQLQNFMYLRKAIITARREQYFTPLANVQNMPKHMGKTMKCYEYYPLLDDRNVNDQGLDAAGASYANGNLYGSSKDMGTITGRLPALSETGGRVNRVGFTRIVREGTLNKFGFFTEFTKEALDFDTDEALFTHLSRELMNGAVKLSEDMLQRDLLNAAGTIMYSGAAVGKSQITGESTTTNGVTTPASVVTYANLQRLDQTLTDLRSPKQTTIITGSRNIDTKVLDACRIVFIGSELVPLVRRMTDYFGNKAFIEARHYADATTLLNGEIGSIDGFRFVQVPDMQFWAGAGKLVGTNAGYRSTVVGGQERYNVYPMLIVGDDAFSTIGFQTDGASAKLNVHTVMPEQNYSSQDPYGSTGFSSIAWYYGILIKRPERIAVVYTVAPV